MSEPIDLGILDLVDDTSFKEGEQDRVFRDYLAKMYVMFKGSFLYDTNNASLVQSCERVAAVANRIRENHGDTAQLAVHAEGSYVNHVLVKLDAGSHDQADYLFAIYSALDVATIAAIGDTAAHDWLQLVQELKTCTGPGGNLEAFANAKLDNIKLTRRAESQRVGAVSISERVRALRAYATCVVALGEVLDSARARRSLRLARVKRPMQELAELSGQHSALLLALAHLKRHKLLPEHHLANSAVFAICAARTLEMPRAVRCEIGMQAALHDLGRALEGLTGLAEGTTAERRSALRSVRELVATGQLSRPLIGRVVVAYEARRWTLRDEEPAGDAPYPFDLATPTAIIAAARAYSLMTTPSREQPCLLPDEALRVIIRDSGRRYDLPAVKLLVNTLGTYPVGSTVRLSDERLAIVVDAPRDFSGPARPRVKIVRDEHGNIVDGEVIDLAGVGGGHLFIHHCVDPEANAINAPAFLLS